MNRVTTPQLFSALRALATALVVFLAAGCKRPPPPEPNANAASAQPSVRLYVLSDVAAALEPCGCSKDQLGGLDHLASFVRAQKQNAPNALMLGAGPLLYIDPTLDAARASQDRWKAEAIADGLRTLGLVAWAPGYNDWAGGTKSLGDVATKSGAVMLASGLGGAIDGLPIRSSLLSDVGGVKVGIVGVSTPRDGAGKAPEGLALPDASGLVPLVKAEIDALKKAGARLLVVTAATQRGAALRLADAIPELDVLVIGKELGRGHGNTAQPPPERIGSTLIVETANHLQTVAVVDVYLRGDAPEVTLADAGGIADAARMAELGRRIRELELRINNWESGGKVDAADLAARKADLAKLRAERGAVPPAPPPPTGSYFRYAVHEVRDGMGKDDAVATRMVSLYKQINEHNKAALKDLVAPKPGKDEASFVGVEECTTCHDEERKVWDGTAHAHAYKTLVDGFKEYNLECVGCHVTGYGKAGGSTVTHNDTLQNVQCEECHGPGSRHVKSPETKGLIVRAPDPKGCVEACHHPPHVEGFDPVAKMELVLGPGHGRD